MYESKLFATIAWALSSLTDGATRRLTQLPPKPWHTVNMDFLVPLPSGEMLLVIIDHYSRFPEVEIPRSTAASATIPKLDSIFARHGYPVKVRTDNGPPWNST